MLRSTLTFSRFGFSSLSRSPLRFPGRCRAIEYSVHRERFAPKRVDKPVGCGRPTDRFCFFAHRAGNRDSRVSRELPFRQAWALSELSAMHARRDLVAGSLRMQRDWALSSSFFFCWRCSVPRKRGNRAAHSPCARSRPALIRSRVFVSVASPSYVKGRIEAGLDERQRGPGHKSALIDKVFLQDAVPSGPNERQMPSDRLLPALKRLGVSIDEGEACEFLRTKGGARGFVDSDEFRRAAAKKWGVDAWAQSLPLAPMLVDALPQSTGCNRLRALCSLTEEEVRAIADGYRDGLQRLLMQHLAQLRAAYEALDKLVKMPRNGASQKFELSAMSCGSIEDFHAGLQKRIGEAARPGVWSV
jgi:hypothetical protein